MGMGSAPTWLHQVSPLLHMTTLTAVLVNRVCGLLAAGAVLVRGVGVGKRYGRADSRQPVAARRLASGTQTAVRFPHL